MADLERDAWLPRLRVILEFGESRPVPGIDRERFRTRYADADTDAVLRDFRTFREENLHQLGQLEFDESALAAFGTHGAFGRVRASELLSTWVVHDLTHMAQINRAMAAQYRSAVGPWLDFLSILRTTG